VYNGVLLKSVTQHTEALLAAAGPPLRLFYRPAVFFRHFRFTAPSFPRGNLGEHVKNVTVPIFFYFFKIP
jgi:hypothetical protein